MEKKKKNWGRVLGISTPAVIVVAVMVCATAPNISCLEVSVEKMEKIFSAFGTVVFYLFSLMMVLTIIWVITLFTTKWGGECLEEMFQKQMDERREEARRHESKN